MTLVRFRTGRGLFAVAVEATREVRPATALMALPAPRAGVAGMVERDGTAVPVLSVLGDAQGRGHVLLLETGGAPFGLLVAEVTGLVRVDPEDLKPAPSGQEHAMVSGVVTLPDGLVFVVEASELGRSVLP